MWNNLYNFGVSLMFILVQWIGITMKNLTCKIVKKRKNDLSENLKFNEIL